MKGPTYIRFARGLRQANSVRLPKAPCKLTQHCWSTTPNIVECYMLRPLAHPVACCCVFFAKFETGQTFDPTTSNISVIAEALRNNFGSVCTALPTLLGPRKHITHGL